MRKNKNPWSPSMRRLKKIKREIVRIVRRGKRSVTMDLHIGDLFHTFEGQHTLSQYYITARILEADLVRKGIFDKSYGEAIARAARGMENSAEKTIHTMKKYREFLEHLDEVGFNPKLGRFSVSSSEDGIFADDGTHRLAWLWWSGTKYVPVSIDDRKPKYPLKGRDELVKAGLETEILNELDRAIEEIKEVVHHDLFVLLRDSVAGSVPEYLSKKGNISSLKLRNKAVNEKVRENEIPDEIWELYCTYKDTPCHLYKLKLPCHCLHLRNGKVRSVAVEEISNEITRITGVKDWGYIAHSITESLELKACLSRLDHSKWE